jgi:hypothetical protein
LIDSKTENYLGSVCFCVSKAFLKKIKKILFFYLIQINIFLVFLDHFDALMSKIILKKIKKIILIHF